MKAADQNDIAPTGVILEIASDKSSKGTSSNICLAIQADFKIAPSGSGLKNKYSQSSKNGKASTLKR